MPWRLIVPFAVTGVLCLLALSIPDSAPGRPPEWLALVGAAVGLAFSAVLVSIAWDAGERTPAFLALGCTSMAIAGVVHLWVYSTEWPGTLPGADGAPVLGMIAGGIWFGLGAIPRSPMPSSERGRVRVELTLLAVMSVVALGLGTLVLPEVADWIVRILAGGACAGYLYAGWRMADAFRLLRLPYQFAMALGSVLFVPVTLFLGAGGMPHISPGIQQAIMLVSASFPAAGFVLEHSKRPGLRTMVLALSIPGAIGAMRRGYPAALMSVLSDVDDYDPALRGHIDRVADLAVQTAQAMAVDVGCLREVMLAGQLHDVGKLFIPRDILDKPGRLDPAETARMQEHSALGARLVGRISELAGAAAAVAQHHERWDGTGYPSGLSGEAIALSARIIAAADVFDALVTARPYKRAWSATEALEELRRCSGTHFDPRVVRAIESIVTEGESRESLAA